MLLQGLISLNQIMIFIDRSDGLLSTTRQRQSIDAVYGLDIKKQNYGLLALLPVSVRYKTNRDDSYV